MSGYPGTNFCFIGLYVWHSIIPPKGLRPKERDQREGTNRVPSEEENLWQKIAKKSKSIQFHMYESGTVRTVPRIRSFCACSPLFAGERSWPPKHRERSTNGFGEEFFYTKE